MNNLNLQATKFDGAPNYEVVILGEQIKLRSRIFNILDLGCGDGRNSFYLSGLNCVVDALDKDIINLSRLKSICDFFKRKINIIHSDVTSFTFQKKYDIILCHGLLHFLSADVTEDLLDKIISHTAEGGINIYTTAYHRPEDKVPTSFLEAGYKNEYTIDRLIKFYNAWNIILNEDYFKWDYHHSFGTHGHRIQKFISQKNGSDIVFDIFEINVQKNTQIGIDDLKSFICRKRNDVLLKFNIQNSIIYFLTGPQFCFGDFAENGLKMEFDFTENLIFQSNNDIISGITILNDTFKMVR